MPEPQDLVSDLFYSYEEDLGRLVEGIKTKLTELDDAADRKGDTKKLDACSKMANEAEQCLKQMEMEVRTLPGKAPELMPRVADHRRALEAVTREVRTRKTEAQRRALLDADGNASAAALEQRQRMKDVEGRIRDGTKQVEEAQRLALETEQIGTGIMTDLHGQRETIQRARANVRVMGSNLDDARRRINNMTSRMLQNKVILYVVSGVLLLVILWILWVKLFG